MTQTFLEKKHRVGVEGGSGLGLPRQLCCAKIGPAPRPTRYNVRDDRIFHGCDPLWLVESDLRRWVGENEPIRGVASKPRRFLGHRRRDKALCIWAAKPPALLG